MATIRPFAALRPQPELASQICELPYDVMSSEEARQMATGNPLSFLHVSKPEIDLPPGTNAYSPAVYAKGRENFHSLIARGALRQDSKPCFYVYRQVMGKHSQTGLVAVASCQEYKDGLIKKHELTRPDKEDDRVRHIEALDAQTGPVFLVYPARGAIDALVEQVVSHAPEIDFTAPDSVRHSGWVVAAPEIIAAIEREFTRIPALYIADGHHRSAAGWRVAETRGYTGASAHFLSVIFPDNQVQILPYNRALKDLNGMTPSSLLQSLEKVAEFLPVSAPSPLRKSEVSVYLEGRWRTFRFRPQFTQAPSQLETLDVAILQREVFKPLLGIDDPRISKRINFVGGIRGHAELEKLVDSGEYACAFSLYPAGIAELMRIADEGGIMPPKSTWFEPKLRDAMFSHLLG